MRTCQNPPNPIPECGAPLRPGCLPWPSGAAADRLVVVQKGAVGVARIGRPRGATAPKRRRIRSGYPAPSPKPAALRLRGLRPQTRRCATRRSSRPDPSRAPRPSHRMAMRCLRPCPRKRSAESVMSSPRSRTPMTSTVKSGKRPAGPSTSGGSQRGRDKRPPSPPAAGTPARWGP
jgi:hypothetical protein